MTPALFEGTPLAGGGTSSAYLPSVFFLSVLMNVDIHLLEWELDASLR